VSVIAHEHKNKGLGQSMYEAMFAHGYHTGAHTIQGDIHSTSASKVHEKLANKHGLEYHATPAIGSKYPSAEKWSQTPSSDYDQKFGPYKYTLKQEIPMSKVDLPGKRAEQVKPLAPENKLQPSRQQVKLPGQSLRAPTLKISKGESELTCDVCSGVQFNNNKFVGCICFKDFAPLIKTATYKDGHVLEFKKGFDVEAYLVLSKYFRGRND
jgi:hypothetical protein